MMDVQWALISVATSSFVHFILRIILGRELGAEGLGIYTLVFTIYLFGMQFAAFGIGAALTQYVAEFVEDKAAIRNYVSSGMTSSIVTGTLMGLALFLIAPALATSLFHTPELDNLVKLTALCYPFIAIQKAVLGTLNGFRRMHLYALLNVVQNISAVGASVVLVLCFNLGIQGAVIGFVFPTILIGIFCPFLIRDCLKFDASLWNPPALRATTAFGFYIVLGNSLSFLNTQVDSILIGYTLNPTEVGIYAVAILLAQTLSLIPSSVQRVTAPTTATLYGKGDIGKIRTVVVSTMKKSFLVSFLIALVIAISGPVFITYFFSLEFIPAFTPLMILLAGHVIYSPFTAVGTTLASIGKVNISFRVNAICAGLNIILNMMLVPMFGIIGAAIATTTSLSASFVINTALIMWYLKKLSKKMP